MTGAPPETREELLGYRVYCCGIAALVDEIVQAVGQRGAPAARWLACLNPHSYAVARADARFWSALQSATWLVPDGGGIVLASHLLRGRIAARVSGPDVFLEVSRALDARGPFSAMFLGSTEATLVQIRQRYQAQFQNVQGLHTHSPAFRDAFSEADILQMQALLRRHRPDVLWLGLTAPKQEILLARLSQTPDFRFAAGIGAAFDFYVGNVSRSPALFRRLGLEWLPRLLQQPRRLWRRTFVSAPIFLWDVLRAALTRTGPPP